MKTVDEIIDYLTDHGAEDALVFRGPDYTSAFVGVSYDDRAVYDYNKMIEYLMETEHMSYDDAADFIDYNESFAPENGPIILFPVIE